MSSLEDSNELPFYGRPTLLPILVDSRYVSHLQMEGPRRATCEPRTTEEPPRVNQGTSMVKMEIYEKSGKISSEHYKVSTDFAGPKRSISGSKSQGLMWVISGLMRGISGSSDHDLL